MRFDGASTRGLRPHEICRRGLARTFQIVKPFQGLTVLENVRVGALARTRPFGDATRKAREVLALVGLDDRADRTARGLTLADRKRLGARARPGDASPGSCCSTRSWPA